MGSTLIDMNFRPPTYWPTTVRGKPMKRPLPDKIEIARVFCVQNSPFENPLVAAITATRDGPEIVLEVTEESTGFTSDGIRVSAPLSLRELIALINSSSDWEGGLVYGPLSQWCEERTPTLEDVDCFRFQSAYYPTLKDHYRERLLSMVRKAPTEKENEDT